MHMGLDDTVRQGTKAVTVRLDVVDYDRLKAQADRLGVSLNTVVREAVAAYGVRVERLAALEELGQFHQKLAAEGRQGPDEAVEILRQLRLERAEHLERLEP